MRAFAVKDADTKRRRGRGALSRLLLAEDSAVGIQQAGYIGIRGYVGEDDEEGYFIDEIAYPSVVFYFIHCETSVAVMFSISLFGQRILHWDRMALVSLPRSPCRDSKALNTMADAHHSLLKAAKSKSSDLRRSSYT